jgi:nucleoside-diphosphate-sugar epimerase
VGDSKVFAEPVGRERLVLLGSTFKLRYVVIYESHFRCTFIHVYDIAHSFLFGIENDNRMQGQVYNVASDDMNYSKAPVCEMIQQKVDYYWHYDNVGEDADKRNYVVS